MTHRSHLVSAAAALLAATLVCSAGRATAQDVTTESHPMGQHPAVLVQRQAQTIDTNRFIVAHPARLMVIATPTPTYAHPAIAVARMGRAAAGMDATLAQPPVAAGWLRHADTAAMTAATSAAAADATTRR